MRAAKTEEVKSPAINDGQMVMQKRSLGALDACIGFKPKF